MATGPEASELVQVSITIRDIDAATAGAFRAELRGALEHVLPPGDDVHDGPVRPVVVDLRAIAFMDSTGVRELVEADQAAREVGARIQVIADDGPVRRVLEITGLWDHFAAEDRT